MPTDRVTVTPVRVERNRTSGVSPVPAPHLSWTVTTSEPDWMQASAELRLDRDGATVQAEVGAQSVLVPWPFDPLVAGSTASIRVRVTSTRGDTSEWSDAVTVTAGFLDPGGWTAPYVGLPAPSKAAQPVLLRGVVDLTQDVRRATLFATARGVYQATVNGVDVDGDRFKPGWTAYQWRVIHESTDVTALLAPGRNVLGARLAGGWYTEEYGFGGGARRFYGDQPALAMQLEVEYVDGSRDTLITGPEWRATEDGPLRSSSIYLGEHYDATREIPGWGTAEFDDSGWSPVAVLEPGPTPEPRVGPPVRHTGTLPVLSVITTPSGRTVLDFGQNMVGHVRFTASGERGERVTLRHAEVLEHGELGTRPLRRAIQTDQYVLAGGAPETWEPEFTFHGFRYVEVDGWSGELDPTAFEAVVVHSDMARTGGFECSDDLLNRLHENAVWGMRGNFLSIPSDCPQRDERWGWTGDIQVFGPTASFLFDTDGFLVSWLRDLALEQEHNGGVVPVIVPSPLTVLRGPVAAWGDAASILPWVLDERFADAAAVAAQYPSMRAWAETVIAESDPQTLLWDASFQFGDWLDPDAPADLPGRAKTQPDVVATAHVFRTLTLTARAAEREGEHADAQRYAALAERVRIAFLSAYVTPAGRMVSDAPTAYAMAIVYDLAVEPDLRSRLGDRLASLVRASGFHIGTGFVGTPIILDALTSTGHDETAERLLMQTENPSWLYPVTMGATTIWERWDSMLEDGSINPGEMTSFNHYAFGAVADWMHRRLAGLAPEAAGYRRIRIEPLPLPALSFARAHLDSPYGPIRAGWTRSPDGTVVVEAAIPPGTTATVVLPDGRAPFAVGSGSHRWTVQFAAPRESLPALSLASDLGGILDDREAYVAVMTAIRSVAPEGAIRLRRQALWSIRRTLGESIAFMPGVVTDAVLEALAVLNSRRGPRH